MIRNSKSINQSHDLLGHVAALAAVLVVAGVALHVAVEHGLVHAGVVAVGIGALEGLAARVVAHVVLQVVLVLGDEAAAVQRAEQQLLRLDVHPLVVVVVVFLDGQKLRALLTTVRLVFAAGIPRPAG